MSNQTYKDRKLKELGELYWSDKFDDEDGKFTIIKVKAFLSQTIDEILSCVPMVNPERDTPSDDEDAYDIGTEDGHNRCVKTFFDNLDKKILSLK